MITGAIPDEGRSAPPVLVLGVQYLDELLQVELECDIVRVGLEEAGVDLSLAVEGSDQGDIWADLRDWNPNCILSALPTEPPVISRIQPGLVDVNQAFFRLDQLQELDGRLLSEHQTAFDVCLGRDLLDFIVAEAEVILHNLDHFRDGCLSSLLFLEELHDISRSLNHLA